MQNLKYLNRIPTGMSYLLKRDRVWGQPLFFTIETLNNCNFKCVYCPQSEPEVHFKNGRGQMSLPDFKKIVANLRACFDVQLVSLHRDGEPMLNIRLESYISHLTELGIHVTMSSNCSLVTEARAKSILAAGLRFINTDFCADADIYEKLRVGGVWTETLEGLRMLLRAADELGTDFQVVIKDMATHDAPPAEAPALLARTRELFTKWPNRVTVVPVRFHNALGESAMDLGKVGPASDRSNYSLCHQPWVNFTVDFAGRVVACCRDLRSEYVIGNLLEQSADEVWNGERMMELRRALREKRPEDIAICGACDVPWSGSYSGRTPLEKAKNFFLNRAWAR